MCEVDAFYLFGAFVVGLMAGLACAMAIAVWGE